MLLLFITIQFFVIMSVTNKRVVCVRVHVQLRAAAHQQGQFKKTVPTDLKRFQ